eukprot:Pgem_evm1s11511
MNNFSDHPTSFKQWKRSSSSSQVNSSRSSIGGGNNAWPNSRQEFHNNNFQHRSENNLQRQQNQADDYGVGEVINSAYSAFNWFLGDSNSTHSNKINNANEIQNAGKLTHQSSRASTTI